VLFVIFKFRGKPDDPEPKQVHGNTMVEVIWTAIPALVLAMNRGAYRRRSSALTSSQGRRRFSGGVIGHQWWWSSAIPAGAHHGQ
jgi:cytochrome c oxidase subunit 2